MTATRSEHRAELDARIMAAARRQLAERGAAGLTMRQIARDLDLTPGALYRYVADRDALLTRLIVEAYDSLGACAEAASAAAASAGERAQWLAVFRAARQWAIERPHEFALIYGTPVIGYAAPASTIEPASRLVGALVVIALGPLAGASDAQADEADATRARRASTRVDTRTPQRDLPADLRADLAAVRAWTGMQFGPEAQARASDEAALAVIRAWTELVGAISFECFGHFAGSIEHAAAFVDEIAARHADELGLS